MKGLDYHLTLQMMIVVIRDETTIVAIRDETTIEKHPPPRE